MKSVITKLKELITNNIVLKIAAIFIAAIVWLAVVNLSDPTKTVTIYGVPISLKNEEAITGQNKVYAIDSKLTLNVTVTGKRSVVSELSADDFDAVAPLDEISVVNSVQVEVNTKRKSVEGRISIVNQSVKAITVDIEDLVEEEYPVEIVMDGKPANGYYLGNYSSSRNSIIVTAPKSVQKRISSAKIIVDIDGAKVDFEDRYAIVLYDDNGEVVKDKNITKSYKKSTVSVEILKGSSVPIVVNYSGQAADGYSITGVECTPEKVVVVGKNSAIADIKGITIPSEAVTFENAKENVEIEVDVNKYLPEKVSVSDSSDSTVKITIDVEKLQKKKFTISKNNISLKNVESNYNAEMVSDSITVTLVGLKSDLEKVSSDDIKASINLKGLKETKTVDVDITVPKNTELSKSVSAKVKITKK